MSVDGDFDPDAGWAGTFEVPGHPDWKVRAEIELQGGAWVVKAIEVVPMQTPVIDGALRTDLVEEVPPFGLRQDVLRKIPLAEVARAIAGVRWTGGRPMVDLFGGEGTARRMRKRPTRRRLTDRDYALWAQKYEAACVLSASPIKDLAKAEGWAEYTVRDRIAKARDLGLLTPAPSQGKPGGSLTERARALINEEDTE